MESRGVVDQVFALAAQGRQDEIARLTHPDAVVVPFLSPDTLLVGRRASESYLNERMLDHVREGLAERIEQIGDDRFVVVGRVRWSLPAGLGFRDSGAAWAVVVKDGLIYRMKGTSTRAAALAILEAEDWTPRREREDVTDGPGAWSRWAAARSSHRSLRLRHGLLAGRHASLARESAAGWRRARVSRGDARTIRAA